MLGSLFEVDDCDYEKYKACARHLFLGKRNPGSRDREQAGQYD